MAHGTSRHIPESIDRTAQRFFIEPSGRWSSSRMTMASPGRNVPGRPTVKSRVRVDHRRRRRAARRRDHPDADQAAPPLSGWVHPGGVTFTSGAHRRVVGGFRLWAAGGRAERALGRTVLTAAACRPRRSRQQTVVRAFSGHRQAQPHRTNPGRVTMAWASSSGTTRSGHAHGSDPSRAGQRRHSREDVHRLQCHAAPWTRAWPGTTIDSSRCFLELSRIVGFPDPKDITAYDAAYVALAERLHAGQPASKMKI